MPVKTTAEQAATIIVKHREMLSGNGPKRSMRCVATPWNSASVAAKGEQNVAALVVVLGANAAIPAVAREMFAEMGRHIADLDRKLRTLDRQLLEQHKANPVSGLLAEIPGVGPITAITMALCSFGVGAWWQSRRVVTSQMWADAALAECQKNVSVQKDGRQTCVLNMIW